MKTIAYVVGWARVRLMLWSANFQVARLEQRLRNR
jgi:hypothetical protein